MWDVCSDFEVELVEFNGEDNHVHLLVNFPEGRDLPPVELPERGVVPPDAAVVPRVGCTVGGGRNSGQGPISLGLSAEHR